VYVCCAVCTLSEGELIFLQRVGRVYKGILLTVRGHSQLQVAKRVLPREKRLIVDGVRYKIVVGRLHWVDIIAVRHLVVTNCQFQQ
jgi:hypothetical protein